LGEGEENLALMRLLDEQYTRAPFYGSRKMAAWLGTQGFEVNRKRVSRLMTVMGIEAVYPKPKLSVPGEGHKVYPYLLRGVAVNRINQVWSTDITYIRMSRGFALPGGCDGLVQPVCLELEIVGEPGTRFLRRGAEVRSATGTAADLQYGPGVAVYQ
jgi:hypothetical protein